MSCHKTIISIEPFFYDVTFNKKSPIHVPKVTSYYKFDYRFIYTTRDHDYKQ